VHICFDKNHLTKNCSVFKGVNKLFVDNVLRLSWCYIFNNVYRSIDRVYRPWCKKSNTDSQSWQHNGTSTGIQIIKYNILFMTIATVVQKYINFEVVGLLGLFNILINY